MMFPALLLAPAWFGPSTVDLAFPTSGNPFSPTENDVRCVFTQKGKRFERLGYFAKGKWHATLAANMGGAFQARFVLNGKPVGKPLAVTLAPAKSGDFVLLDGNRFRLTSGSPYVPFGHNFGWQNGADATYSKQLADMHTAGLNWTRVWADSWDSKNPYYPPDKGPKLALGWMFEPALDRWDMVVDNCDKNDIKLQFVLFHHGLFSTTTDSNWAGHPWNKANGGFLADPTDFFSDPQAKRLTKAWLRYAVARWGHSPAIMAWELFNEVQWVDAVKLHPERIDSVAAWHHEMGDYVRSIDPYNHLVTSSSNEALDPRVLETMDYEQPHTYPPSVYGAILGAPMAQKRPIFFGEFGGNGGKDAGDQEKLAVRDGFWAGLLAGQAGPGQYWFWNRVYKRNLYEEYARDAKILKRTGFAENPDAAPATIDVKGGTPTDLVLKPGRGWGSTAKFDYILPSDAASGALPLLSGYIQGAKSPNRWMMREPLHFRFNANAFGEARIHVAQVSKGGGGLRISINNAPLVSRDWPTAAAEAPAGEDIVFGFKPGRNDMVIDNPGNDWVMIDSITLPGIGAGVSAVSLRSDHYALVRLQWQGSLDGESKTISMAGLKDGAYELRQFNLDTGTEMVTKVNLKGGVLVSYTPYAKDEGLAFFKQ